MEADVLRGLAVSESGLTLDSARRSARPRPVPVRLPDPRQERARRARLRPRAHQAPAPDGRAPRHDRLPAPAPGPARRRHLDGAADADEPGSYRVFADFSFHSQPYTLADDLQVDGTVPSRPLPAPAKTAATDGFRVRLTDGPVRAGQESLPFTVTRDGRPVRLQDYLGAKGHLVALREGDLAYLHVHPDKNRLRFEAGFPNAGRYRLFLQFKVAGQVHTAAFTLEVSQPARSSRGSNSRSRA